MEYGIRILARLIALVCVFSPHEFAHAFVAYKNGDPTAKIRGRMTLNPFRHLDPVGYVLCAAVGFGWAKPVPIDPYNFKNYKRGMFTTAVAGVITNYIVAFFAYMFFVIALRIFVIVPATVMPVYYVEYFVETTFFMIFAYSLYSVVFNLLPLYPLDGFRVVEAFTRQVNPVHRFLRNYGQVILIILVVEAFICNIVSEYLPVAQYFSVLHYVSWFAQNIIGFPIKVAWNWVIKL